MDKVFLEEGIDPDFSMFINWIFDIKKPKVVVLSNIGKLFDEIYKNKALLSPYLHIIFLKRPFNIIKGNFKKPNTDGIYHPTVTDLNFYYERWNERFEMVADTIIEYNGNSEHELSLILTSEINKIDTNILTNFFNQSN